MEQKHDGYDVAFSNDCSGRLNPGESRSCIVTNDDIVKTGSVLIKKHVINDDGNSKVARDFTIHVTGNSPSPSSFKGSEAGKTVKLRSGPYSVSEDQQNDYSSSLSPECSGSIRPGENRICVVTNDDKATAGSLLIKKHVINDNSGGNQASDFTMRITGNDPSPSTFAGDESGVEVKLKRGSYSVSETGPVGYERQHD